MNETKKPQDFWITEGRYSEGLGFHIPDVISREPVDHYMHVREVLPQSPDRRAQDGEWVLWDGEYEKQTYIVKSPKHGKIFECWPNAGVMNVTRFEDSDIQLKPGECFIWVNDSNPVDSGEVGIEMLKTHKRALKGLYKDALAELAAERAKVQELIGKLSQFKVWGTNDCNNWNEGHGCSGRITLFYTNGLCIQCQFTETKES